MKNPIIIDGEILLSDEDIFQFIREKAGDEVTKEIQRIIDDLRMENCFLANSVDAYDSCKKELVQIEMEIRNLIRQIETDAELNRHELRQQTSKIYKKLSKMEF